MQRTPPEVAIAFFAFTALWVLVAALVLLGGRRMPAVQGFRQRMLEQRGWALGIALVYLVAGILGSGLEPGRMLGVAVGSISVLCQSLIGLAVARGIRGFEPLPDARMLLERARPWPHITLRLALTLVIALVAGAVGLVIGSVGIDIGRELFGEVNRSAEAAGMLPGSKLQTFFLLLAGAGIAEETTYRLVALSLVWRWTGRRWLAILVSAALFGAYHLSPLSGMYLVFWQFPVSQFLGSMLIGILWGFLYARRGYETAVLGHTASDAIGVAFFT